MDPQCQRAQEELVRSGGRVESLPEDLKRHVDRCDACRDVARLERELAQAFELAIPEAEGALIPALLQRLPARRWRMMPWIPVPLAGGIVAGALLALGGLPGAGAGEALPAATGQVGIDILHHLATQMAEAPRLLASVSCLVPGGIGVGAVLTGAGTLLILVRTLLHVRRELG